ncbi:MAG: hypothetical protein MRERV_3c063 [Mycoplasmataceae bacterium RV_VA103A]|nr:MAG: hypothetical protein MRERV_3c063 [Mycoplasmataceae bacterium RV_VA103A]
MPYEITERDFLNLVDKPHCVGTETTNGLAKEGHANCQWCKGNYFVGGQCNYGGQHLMADDLRIINKSFRQFDTLENRKITLDGSKSEKAFNKAKEALITQFETLEAKCQDDVSKSEFFGGTCISIDGTHNVFLKKIQTSLKLLAKDLRYYIEKLRNTTWEQLKAFQEKKEKLGQLQREATQLLQEWKEEKDLVKKNQLYAAYQAKLRESKIFLGEIKKDPIYDLFSDEKEGELRDIIQKIWTGETSFLRFQKEEEDKEGKKKYLGFIPQKWGKRIMYGGIVLVILLLAYFVYRWITNKS